MTPDDMVARVLYRDGLMLVINKPAGLPVHRGPKGGASLEDFFDALRFGLPRAPALAHRLDKETSGCLVLGRHRKALAHLGLLFKHGKVHKTYWAVVEGGPQEDEGVIDLPLGRLDQSRGWWMKPDPSGQPAVTKWQVLGRAVLGGGPSAVPESAVEKNAGGSAQRSFAKDPLGEREASAELIPFAASMFVASPLVEEVGQQSNRCKERFSVGGAAETANQNADADTSSPPPLWGGARKGSISQPEATDNLPPSRPVVFGRSTSPSRGEVAAISAPRSEPTDTSIVTGAPADASISAKSEKPKTLTWLVLEPVTGRTHQLRVHCAAMGWPIVGDNIYGTAPRFDGPGLHLHAREISVPLSKSKAPVRITAPVPAHMQQLLAACGCVLFN